MGCSGEQSTYNDAFASSYFKMSKMFGLRGVNQGAAYGVQTQPCQVIGEGGGGGGWQTEGEGVNHFSPSQPVQ